MVSGAASSSYTHSGEHEGRGLPLSGCYRGSYRANACQQKWLLPSSDLFILKYELSFFFYVCVCVCCNSKYRHSTILLESVAFKGIIKLMEKSRTQRIGIERKYILINRSYVTCKRSECWKIHHFIIACACKTPGSGLRGRGLLCATYSAQTKLLSPWLDLHSWFDSDWMWHRNDAQRPCPISSFSVTWLLDGWICIKICNVLVFHPNSLISTVL